MARGDTFLKIDGLDGESRDLVHKDEIDIVSYSFGVSNAGGGSPGGAPGTSKPMVRDMHFTKRVDIASPNLFIACCTGRHFAKATLTVRKAGEVPIEYLVVTLYDVYVSNFDASGDSNGEIGREAFALNFAKIEKKYTPQTEKGAKGAVNAKTFDVRANRAS